MKLLYSTTSPYARKVRVVAHEKGVQEQIEVITSPPAEKSAELMQANPLGKVPALITDVGEGLYDSPVICEYLDSLPSNTLALFPTGEIRWPALRAQALADGVLDIAISVLLERRRDQAEQSPAMIQRWQQQICTSLTDVSQQLQAIKGALNIGHISIAVALSYLDFRHDELQWRSLVDSSVIDWHAEFLQRPSMQQTAPPQD